MKLRHLPSFCAALLALCPTLANAESSAVPNYISYQGFVVDAAGDAVGAGTPVNRTVIFRIWGHQDASLEDHLIYSEQQTVTISDGQFSVLVGQGIANTVETYSYSETTKKLADLGGAFNGSLRFLGVTVASDATIAITDNEISPRQQIVSTAFAMRAKFAESISSSSDLALTPLIGTASNYGLGWYGTGRPFGTAAVDGPVLYGNAGGALGSNSDGSMQTALRWDASGRVGIGATSINSASNKLTLQGDMATTPADQLTIRGNLDNDKRMLLGYDTTANKASLQSYTASAMTGQLLLNPSGGNVGINNSAPSVALGVTGAIKASGDLTAANVSTGQLSNGGAAVVTLSGNNVGIGTTTPTEKLDVAGNIKSNGKSVPTTDEANLKIVRGTLNITSSGAYIGAGNGFTARKNGTGETIITFSTPFSDKPSVTANVDLPTNSFSGDPAVVGTRSTTTSAVITTFRDGRKINAPFSFLAIGQR